MRLPIAPAARVLAAIVLLLAPLVASDHDSPRENTDGCGFNQQSQLTTCNCCTSTTCTQIAEEATCLDGMSSYYPLAFEELHTAVDFRIAARPQAPSAAASACSSCGGMLPGIGELPRLEIERLHRLRGFWIESSLGLGVFLGYDRRIRLFPAGHPHLDAGAEPVMRLFDPHVMIQHQELYERDPATGDAAIDGVLHARDRQTNVVRLHDAAGLVVPMSALATDRRFTVVVTQQDGSLTTYEVINVGAATSSADPDPAPEWHGRPVRIADRNGNAVVLAYAHDALASDEELGFDRTRLWQLASATDAYGQSATFRYLPTSAPFWRVKSITLPTGRTITYHYGAGDGGMRLTGVGHPDGTTSRFEETAGSGELQNLMVYRIHDVAAEPGHQRKSLLLNKHSFILADGTAVPSNGYLTRRILDGDGALVMRNWMEGLVQWTYVAPGRLLRHTTDLTGTRELAEAVEPFDPASQRPWDVAFRVIRTIDRDASGHSISTVDALGRTLSADRDPATAMVTRMMHADGTTTVTTYNAFRLPLTVVDRLGRRSERTYDARGNLLTFREAVGTPLETTVETWTYNALGQPLTRRDALGRVTEYAYGADRRLASMTEPPDAPDGTRAIWRFAYDINGRLTRTTDPDGRAVDHGYDAGERLASITYGDGSQERFVYGTAASFPGLLMRSTDRNGVATTYAYDLTTRLVRRGIAVGTPVETAEVCTYVPGTQLEASCTLAGDRVDRTYDPRRLLIAVSVRVNTGRALTTSFRHDALGRLVQETDPYGRRSFHVLDVDDREVRTVRESVPGGLGTLDPAAAVRAGGANPSYVVTERILDAEGQILADIDPRGVRTTMVHDQRGRVRERIVADRTGSSRASAGAMNPAARRTVHHYDAAGNQVRVELPRSYVRDAATGAFSDGPEGAFATISTYTGRDRLASETIGAGLALGGALRPERAIRSWTYTLTGKVASERDQRGNVTRYAYHACCDRLASITDAAGFVTTLAYDAVGNPVSRTDPLGHATTTAYDARNRASVVTNGAGESMRTTYDDDATDAVGLSAAYAAHLGGLGLGAGSDGAIVATTDHLGATTLQVMDGAGRPVRTIDALGHAETIIHDTVAGGLVETRRIDPLGSISRLRHDGLGNLREVWDEEGRRALLATYDAAGNRLSERDADGVGRACAFDAFGSDIRCTDTAGAVTTRTWDRHGNLASDTDALGATTRHAYDSRDRRTATTDRLGGVTRFAYAANDLVTAVTDAEGRVTRYAYDARRDLLALEIYPGHGDFSDGSPFDLRAYAYDAVGRLTRRLDQSLAVTTYAYDAADRLISRRHADGRADLFGYDGAGRLTSAASQRYANTVQREHDAVGRLTRETQRIGGVAHEVSYAHDAAGRTTRITHPSGTTVTRTLDRRGDLTGTAFGGSTVATMTRTAAGRLATRRYAATTPLTETRTYRPDGLVASIATPGVQALSYTYDAAKRKTREGDALAPAETQTFGYDAEGRLTSWRRTAADTQTWALSLVGDWNATTRDGATQTRTHTPVHQIATIAGIAVGHDARGNVVRSPYDADGELTTDPSASIYGWDVENRLASARISDADEGLVGTARYEYDALGRRVRKHVFGMTTTFLHDGARVIQELDAPQALAGTAMAADGSTAGGPPGGSILAAASTLVRVNFQPATREVPSGFLGDKGRVYGPRTTGRTYGWSLDRTASAVARIEHPYPQFDTFVPLQLAGQVAASWELALPNGSYPVIVVMGDAASRARTNHVLIEGVAHADPDPAGPDVGYERGDFDGYAAVVTVSDGRLTIAAGVGAIEATLCFIEVGQPGGTIDQATRDRLAGGVRAMTVRTGGTIFPPRQESPRQYVYGEYVDEVLMLVAGSSRFHYHANHLHSVVALTDASGVAVERYRYDAYGQRTILAASGTTVLPGSALGNAVGFTGRYHDAETGLTQYRTRSYSPHLGRFLNRMPWHGMGERLRFAPISPWVMPTHWRRLAIASLDEAIGSYIQSRFHLYDFNQWDPANRVEPFSNSHGSDEADDSEHKTNQRESNRETHEEGQRRKQMDRGGEKGDERRPPPRRRPPGHTGPWPPRRGGGRGAIIIICLQLLAEQAGASEPPPEPEREPEPPREGEPGDIRDIDPPTPDDPNAPKTYGEFLDRLNQGEFDK